jgi:hypothetical protein
MEETRESSRVSSNAGDRRSAMPKVVRYLGKEAGVLIERIRSEGRLRKLGASFRRTGFVRLGRWTWKHPPLHPESSLGSRGNQGSSRVAAVRKGMALEERRGDRFHPWVEVPSQGADGLQDMDGSADRTERGSPWTAVLSLGSMRGPPTPIPEREVKECLRGLPLARRFRASP